MNSTRGHRRGRSRGRRSKPRYPLVKPDEFRQPENVSQNDEKPRVQKLELTVNEGGESAPKQFAQGVSTKRKVKASKQTKSQNVDSVLLRAVNNPVFVPKTSQEPVKFNPAETSSVHLASAAKTTEFVLGEGFFRHEEQFVNIKIKQLTEDPGLLDELSAFMADYLSAYQIRAENDMIKLSDILFEKCVSEQNFQYIGSRLANYLDKYLIPKTRERLSFRRVFLKRCSNEVSRLKDVIDTNPERACNVAIFLGELLMNYKTNGGERITKFLIVVSDIINQLLLCPDRKFLICAGKLLKLTGRLLDQKDELFDIVARLASNPRVDRTAQMLFSRVCKLRRTSWGQHETPQPSMYTHSNAYGAQGYSMYIPNLDSMLEEQAPDLPVFAEEEWNEYPTDSSSQDELPTNNDELTGEDLYRSMSLEHYGYYVPYTTEDNWSGGQVDDYDVDYEKFLMGQHSQQ